MSVCERCTENQNCAWQNHEETIWHERPAFPLTNADRIRAMTDEELADFITPVKCVDCHLLDCGVEEEMLNGKRRTCQERVLDWLKQESEV